MCIAASISTISIAKMIATLMEIFVFSPKVIRIAFVVDQV